MAVFQGYCGPSNQQASRAVSLERSLNEYPRRVTSGTPKAEFSLYPRPGLRLFTYLGTGSVTALFSNDGLSVYGVGGSVFYEVLSSGTVVPRGSVRPSAVAASICSMGTQGHQIGVVSGGRGYIYDTISQAFTQITDDAFPTVCVQMVFYASSFVALSATDGKIVVSSPLDGTMWNNLDTLIQTTTSDQTISMLRVHDNLFLFGQRNTIPMYNAGTGGAAGIVPVQGTVIEHGISSPYVGIELDNAAIWLQTDSSGAGVVVRADGYTPQIVSTTATSYALSKVTNYAGATSWGYQEQGQTFFVLQAPGLDTTPCLDLSTGLWHERDHWSPQYGRSFRYVGANHCYAWGKHLVGDRQSGAVYEQSMAFVDDALVTS